MGNRRSFERGLAEGTAPARSGARPSGAWLRGCRLRVRFVRFEEVAAPLASQSAWRHAPFNLPIELYIAQGHPALPQPRRIESAALRLPVEDQTPAPSASAGLLASNRIVR